MSDFPSPSKSLGAMLVTTLSSAALVVAEPLLFVATHRYCVPFNPTVAPLTVNVAVIAPL